MGSKGNIVIKPKMYVKCKDRNYLLVKFALSEFICSC